MPTKKQRAGNGPPKDGSTDPPAKVRRKPGPPPVRLTDQQKQTIIQYTRHGRARALAVSEAGVTYRIFLREMRLDRQFRESIEESARVEHAQLKTVVRAAADTNPVLGLQLLIHRQKSAMLQEARREKARLRKELAAVGRIDGPLHNLLLRIVDIVLREVPEARRQACLAEVDKLIALGVEP